MSVVPGTPGLGLDLRKTLFIGEVGLFWPIETAHQGSYARLTPFQTSCGE